MRKLAAVVVAAAAIAVPVVTATTAVATTVDREARVSTAAPIPAWWHYATYERFLDCERDGKSFVSRGIAQVYSCDDTPWGWELHLFTN